MLGTSKWVVSRVRCALTGAHGLQRSESLSKLQCPCEEMTANMKKRNLIKKPRA